MQLDGMIFDLEGTLTDTFAVCFTAFRETIRSVTGRCPTDDEIFAHFGPSEEGMFQRWVPDRWESCLQFYLSLYEREHQRIGRVSAHVVDPLAEKGDSDKIGSTAIREAILSGAVDRAADMSGRPWVVTSIVEGGNKVGRTLGFPTANLTLGELIEPRRGVYAVRATVRGARIGAVANFGRLPTVGAPAPLLEVHLFDFVGDIYGETIDVAFIRFFRDERKFAGLEALKAQIAEDCLAARAMLAEAP